MSAPYRHTQVGGVILGFAMAVVALVWTGLPAEAVAAARVPLLLVTALVLLVFSALTVEVDGDAIRLRFGVGLVRKRIPLRDVKSWREVRNPWYSGWGIHLIPGSVLWNVSGFDAVELALGDGKRFRIGTDEPAALTAAITRAKGEAPTPAGTLESPWPTGPRGGVAWKGGLLVLALGAAAVGALFWSQIRPPKVAVGPEGFQVETLFYGASFAAGDIAAVSLESIPGAPAPGIRDRQLPRAREDARSLRRDGARLARSRGDAPPVGGSMRVRRVLSPPAPRASPS